MTGGPDPRFVQARASLLDALDALEAHHSSLTLVGAQAVYLRTGPGNLGVAAYTTDGDLALDPALMAREPLIELAMTSRGFARGDQPGAWLSKDGIVVDLLVAYDVAGKGRRSVQIPPHDKNAARRAKGLETALVNRTIEEFGSLDAADSRSHRIGVAGPVALLVAKAHKLGERVAAKKGGRTRPKDALDIYRLLLAYDTAVLVDMAVPLLIDPRCMAATAEAFTSLERLFDPKHPVGAEFVAQSLLTSANPVEVMDSSMDLIHRLLTGIRSRG